MRRVATLLIGATVAAVALPAAAQMAGGPLTPDQFVMKAGASDKFEITEAKLMVTSSSPAAQKFAQMMLVDHQRSTLKVKTAAGKDKVQAGPAMLEPKQQAMVDQLSHTPAGPKRVALYIQQQKMSHQEALMLHQTEAQSGTTPALRKAASEIVPVVQSHIAMLDKMPNTSL